MLGSFLTPAGGPPLAGRAPSAPSPISHTALPLPLIRLPHLWLPGQ